MSTRRGFLIRTGILAAGATGLWLARDHLTIPWVGARVEGPDESGWLPFATRRQRVVAIPVGIGGRRINALLDSGAQYSAIDTALAERLGLTETLGAPVVAYGAGGGGQVGRSVALSVTIGDLTVSRLTAAALTLGPIAMIPGGAATPLILGQDVLRLLVADIDFPRRQVRLVRPDAFDMPPGALPAPAQSSGRALSARVLIEGVEMSVLVDTGASAALSLRHDTAEALGLLERPHRTGEAVVLGGVARSRIVKARTFSFAGHDRRDVDVHIFQAPNVPGAPNGLLGYDALRRWRTILDLKAGAMHLVRQEDR